MTAQNRSVNKARFEQGDTPQGSDFTDFIDSYLALTDSTAQSVASHVTLSGGVATTTVSANALKVVNSASDSFLVLNVSTTATALGGAASTVPTVAAGYLTVEINGVLKRIAFFNPQ